MASLRSRQRYVAFPFDKIFDSIPENVEQLLGQGPSNRRGGWQSVRELSALEIKLATTLAAISRDGLRGQNAGIAEQLRSLQKGPVGVALLRVIAAAVRVELGESAARSPAGQQGSAAVLGWLKLGIKACEISLFIAQAPTSSTFFRSLLAAQTLQASARQLAAAAALLGDQRPQPTGEEVELVERVLQMAVLLVNSVCVHLDTDEHPGAGVEVVTAALRHSHIMEHMARLLMRLRGTGEAGGLRRTEGCREAEAVMYSYFRLSLGNFGVLPSPQPEEEQLAQATSGPCADFAAMAFGLAALCAADGGSWHGLPEGVRECLPVPTAVSSSMLAPAALAAAICHGVRAGRMSRRTGVVVLMRVCRMGLASVESGWHRLQAEESGRSSSGGAGPSGSLVAGPFGSRAEAPPQPAYDVGRVLPPESLATCCLIEVRTLLAGRPAAWADVAEEWWRAAVALLRPPEGAKDWSLRVGLPISTFVPQDATIPPAPQPDLAAALAAGLLPTLERLIRRAGEDAEGPEAGTLDFIRGALVSQARNNETVRPFFTPLLAHGDPRHAAALVATCSKMVRRAGGTSNTGTTADKSRGADLVLRILSEIHDVLTASRADISRGTTEGAPGVPGPALEAQGAQEAAGPAPGAPPQLRTLLGCVLREWLPELCRWTLRSSWLQAQERLEWSRPLLRWMRVLAMTAMWVDRQAGAAGAAHGAATSGGSWADLLWRDSDLVPLLGALLARADEMDEYAAVEIAQACLVLAAACPAELWAATRASAAAAGLAATAGKSAASSSGSAADEGCAGMQPDEAGLPLPPSQLRRLVPKLRRLGDCCGGLASAVEALGLLLELWVSGNTGVDVGEEGAENSADVADHLLHAIRSSAVGLMEKLAPVGRMLGPPVAASSLLGVPTCANPRCVSLKGDSELGVRLQRCGRCGAVGYCCRECQTAHWRAAHKEACVLRGASAHGGGGEG